MAFLELKNVCKGYGDGENRHEVLQNIDLKIEEGEFIALIGFSGSGKTTLISLISGLLMPDDGEILLRGKPITGPGPNRGVVFQNYSLLPWLTVRENIALAVDQVFPRWSEQGKIEHVKRFIAMVNLTPATLKRPMELSGGMRQRVAVARALAINPEILLLDEPLSALDALTRATLQDEIEKIWSQEKKTVVLVTNDVDEGMLLADRIIPLTPGPAATLGPAFEVPFARPRNRKSLNHEAKYKSIRNEIIKYLISIRRRENVDGEDNIVLPDLVPQHSY